MSGPAWPLGTNAARCMNSTSLHAQVPSSKDSAIISCAQCGVHSQHLGWVFIPVHVVQPLQGGVWAQLHRQLSEKLHTPC